MAVFLPGESSDDCTTVPAASDIDLTSVAFSLGRITDYYSSGVRFVNVTIPKGATNLTAKVTLQSRTNTSGTACNLQIKGEGVNDAATFSTYADYAARARTTAFVGWDNLSAWTTGTDYDSPSVAAVIQEIVDRALWVSGNHLVLFFLGDASDTNAVRSAKSYDLTTTLCARLTATWTAAQHYTLTAEAGSYSMTGQSAGLKAARNMAAGAGSYALTGQPVDIRFGRKIAAGPGSYSLTGQDVVLRAIRKLAAEGGSYSYAGQDANLTIGHHYVLTAEAGSYGEPYSKIFVTLDGRIYKKMGDAYLRIS